MGGIGGMFRAGRMLADGDLRLITLALLEETPRHGYDIIKALEERTAGFYSPSPGVVYPTLTFLEEAGYATSSAEGNKKVFAITDAGKAHLQENRELVDGVLEQMARFGRKMARAGEWFDGLDRRSGRHGSGDASAVELAKARRRIAMAVADVLDGSEEDRRHAAEVLNRAADTLEGSVKV